MGNCCTANTEIDSSDDEIAIQKKQAIGCCGMKKGVKKEKIDKMGFFNRTKIEHKYETPGELGGDTAEEKKEI
jgi:hypothetical protein